MSSHADLPPLDGITYKDRLPISWQRSSMLPSESEQHRIDRDNQELLEALLVLAEPAQDSEDEQESGDHNHLRRLDAKLNLLMSLVRELLAAAVTLPDEQMLQLGVHGLCIDEVSATDLQNVQVESLLKIRLFLDPKFPRPLILFAHVSRVDKGSIILTYTPLAVVVQDLLDKHVFRYHRRAIALKRQQAGVSPA